MNLLNGEDADLEELLNLLPPALADRYAVRLRLSQLRRRDAEQRASALEAALRRAGSAVAPLVSGAIAPVPTVATPLPATTRTRRCWRWATALTALVAVAAVIVAVRWETFAREKPEAMPQPTAAPVEHLVAAAPATMPRASLPQQQPVVVKVSCAEVLVRIEAEAAEMEALVRRTIQGYQQMVVAITDWVSGIRRTWAARGSDSSQSRSSTTSESPAGLPSCLARVQAAYEKEAGRVNATLLESHDQRASKRARCRANRRATVGPSLAMQHAMQS